MKGLPWEGVTNGFVDGVAAEDAPAAVGRGTPAVCACDALTGCRFAMSISAAAAGSMAPVSRRAATTTAGSTLGNIARSLDCASCGCVAMRRACVERAPWTRRHAPWRALGRPGAARSGSFLPGAREQRKDFDFKTLTYLLQSLEGGGLVSLICSGAAKHQSGLSSFTPHVNRRSANHVSAPLARCEHTPELPCACLARRLRVTVATLRLPAVPP